MPKYIIVRADEINNEHHMLQGTRQSFRTESDAITAARNILAKRDISPTLVLLILKATTKVSIAPAPITVEKVK